MVTIATECFLFGGFVLTMTAIWVYCLRNRSFTFLAYAMFFPGATAIGWSILSGSILEFISRASGLGEIIRSVLFCFVSVAAVYVIVEGCVIISTVLGWAKKTHARTSAIHKHNQNYLPGFLRAAGEEIGWRCFLLPRLMQSYSPLPALLISGVMWGLFHVPVMIMLIHLVKPKRPYVTVTVQSLSCVFAAFTHGWVAIKSGFSMWPPSVMHAFWNIYNPTVLGSIYTNIPGKYTGEQWKINGEGLMGCLVMVPFMLAIVWELYNPII